MLLTLNVSERFRTQLHCLSENDQRKVLALSHRLSKWHDDPYVQEHSHPLSTLGKDVYIFRGDEKWRLFFRIERNGTEVTLLDFSTREIILQHAKG